MNISNELLKTNIWKDINDSNKQMYEPAKVNKTKKSKTNRKPSNKASDEHDIPLICQNIANKEASNKN